MIKNRFQLVLFIGVVGVALLTGGCASTSKHVVAPSTAGSNRAISGARNSNMVAQKFNDRSRTDAQLIEAKARVIKTYWGK